VSEAPLAVEEVNFTAIYLDDGRDGLPRADSAVPHPSHTTQGHITLHQVHFGNGPERALQLSPCRGASGGPYKRVDTK
jgi:hypothetical protein